MLLLSRRESLARPSTAVCASRWLGAGLVTLAALQAIAPAARAQTWERVDASGGPARTSVALLLTDGTVIVDVPNTRLWYRLAPDEWGDYLHGTWSTLALMPERYGPYAFASAVLADGRVIVEGGEYNNGHSGWTSRGAIYDPRLDSWTEVQPPASWIHIGDAPCVVLPDGRFFLGNAFDRRTAVLDPATLQWSDFGVGKNDDSSEEGWTLLRDGSVLCVDVTTPPATERFLPWLGRWISAGNTPQSLILNPLVREIGPALLMADGTVFAAGGNGHNAIYSPPADATGTGTWSAAPDFPLLDGTQLDMADGPAALLPSGNALCAASPATYRLRTRCFEFDGTRLIPVPGSPRADLISSYMCSMLLLPTGQVLMTDQSGDVEIYTPSGEPKDAWRPTIRSYPTTILPGETYKITGTQFNGLSQGSAYGDECTNATNYPLVRLTSLRTGHVAYARTFGHDTMAVATGRAPTTTQFTVPKTLESGMHALEVVANGIVSLPVQVVRGRPQRAR